MIMENSIKVEVIHLTEEDCYLVKLGNTGRHFEVSGLRLQGCPGSVTVKSLDEITCYRTIPRIITHYENNGTTMSIIDYKNSVDELLSKGEDQYDAYVFDNLDDEYRYKKFTRDWCPVYSESYEEIAPLEFVISEIRTNSGDPDIISLWNSPTLCDNKLYSFDRHRFSLKYFQFLCDRKNLENSVPSHSGLRYAQINNKYIFDSTFDWSKHQDYIGTLEQCKQEKQKILEGIERTIDINTKSKDAELLDAAGVLAALYKIRNYVGDIIPTSKSRTSYSLSINSINSLIKMIEDGVINSVKEEENKS